MVYLKKFKRVYRLLLGGVIACGSYTGLYAQDAYEVWFDTPVLAKHTVITDPDALCYVAKAALRYVRARMARYPDWGAQVALHQIINPQQTLETLEFVVKTIEEDKAADRAARITSPEFLNQHFDYLAWDSRGKGGLGHVRLTHYALFQAKGSLVRTPTHSCPLYRLDDKNVRTLFTCQQIVQEHLYEHPRFRGKVTALVWLTPKDFKQALLQGAIVVDMPDGCHKTFIVGKDNMLKGQVAEKGQRYFFFWQKDEDCSKKSFLGAVAGDITHTKDVMLAGDVDFFGFGKLVLLSYQNSLTRKSTIRLGILADTGVAFSGRPDKLDLFVGHFSNRLHLRTHVSGLPDFVRAHILIRKQPAAICVAP